MMGILCTGLSRRICKCCDFT